MKAVVYQGAGGPEVLAVRDVDAPDPGVEQVRVRVRAAGLNRADVLQRQGRHPAPPGSPRDIPGLEFAGEVEALGPGVQRARVGQRVYGICGGGAQAEYVVVHERLLAPVPECLDPVAAASVPEVFMTVHDALFVQAGFSLGETLLVHAVGSGVGTAAVQLARAAGGRTLGTSRSPAKLERARELGMDVALDPGSFVQGVLEHTGGQGVAVVLDTIGGSYLNRNLAALAPRGRLLLLARLDEAAEPFPVSVVLYRRLHVIGTVLRPRPLEEKIAVVEAFARHVNPLLAAGQVHPVVDRVFALADVAAAHAYLESNASFGKVVLALP